MQCQPFPNFNWEPLRSSPRPYLSTPVTWPLRWPTWRRSASRWSSPTTQWWTKTTTSTTTNSKTHSPFTRATGPPPLTVSTLFCSLSLHAFFCFYSEIIWPHFLFFPFSQTAINLALNQHQQQQQQQCMQMEMPRVVKSREPKKAKKAANHQHHHQNCQCCDVTEKPHLCDFPGCGKRFRQKPHLQVSFLETINWTLTLIKLSLFIIGPQEHPLWAPLQLPVGRLWEELRPQVQSRGAPEDAQSGADEHVHLPGVRQGLQLQVQPGAPPKCSAQSSNGILGATHT